VVIGRDTSCDAVIDTPFASGFQAVVVCLPEGIFCRDLGTTNGTVVNGQRVPREGQVRLRDGDLIHIGSTILRVHAPEN